MLAEKWVVVVEPYRHVVVESRMALEEQVVAFFASLRDIQGRDHGRVEAQVVVEEVFVKVVALHLIVPQKVDMVVVLAGVGSHIHRLTLLMAF